MQGPNHGLRAKRKTPSSSLAVAGRKNELALPQKLTPSWPAESIGTSEAEYMTVQAALVLAIGERSIHDDYVLPAIDRNLLWMSHDVIATPSGARREQSMFGFWIASSLCSSR